MTNAKLPLALKERVQDETPEDPVASLASRIDIYSPQSIMDFGSEIAERTEEYTDRVLAKARNADLDETGTQLTEIVALAREFDVDSITNELGNTPVLGGFLKRISRAKERAIGRFETVQAQVDKIVSDVEKTATTLDRKNRDYQTMYGSVQEEHELIGLHVEAINLKAADLENEILVVSGREQDLQTAEQLAILEANRQALSKRADDLTVLQHSALQMLPMVRIIQSNNLALIDKFQTIRQLTLPAWKRAFMLALALDEQKNAGKLAGAIDDTTNQLLRRNAELLHQNAVSTAKSNQRLVIDVETLKDVHDKILLTLDDVRKVHEDGAEERKEALHELERMREEMRTGAKALMHDHDA